MHYAILFVGRLVREKGLFELIEAMAAVLQGRTSSWDTDLFVPLIGEVSRRAGREYPSDDEGDVSVRVIADHARAVGFMVSDGIMPANDGRGYVLRRLIRRAFRHGNRLGLDEPFLHSLMGVVAEGMKSAYPELLTALPLVAKVCRAEEERFAQTLNSGLRVFRHFVAESRLGGQTVVSGEAAFKLYDTYGFPLDLTLRSPARAVATVETAAEGTVLGSSRVTLEPGTNHVRVNANLSAVGAVDLSGTVRAEGLGEVRFGQALSLRRPKVLFVSLDPPGSEEHLLGALQAAQFEVERSTTGLPDDLGAFQLVVLNNWDFEAISAARKTALEAFVREGGGLLVIGGERNVYVEHKAAED
ncbi:MAG: alanine--tRNA ligase-related protein, partial [Candidatus Aminicenantales bacterium]